MQIEDSSKYYEPPTYWVLKWKMIVKIRSKFTRELKVSKRLFNTNFIYILVTVYFW